MNERNEKNGQKNRIDPELAARARGGDQAAFTELYERTGPALYRSIRSMVRDEDLAWDILQDSYLRAFRSLDKLESDGAFLPWLRRIAVNETARRMSKRLPVCFSELAGEDGECWEPEVPDLRVDSQPELALDRQETARLVREILAGLPEGQQMILGMRYYEDMSVKEIAGTLGVTQGTVTAQLYQGRKKVEARVRALEQQGVKLYGMGPLPFLVALLRKLEPTGIAEREFGAAASSGASAAGSAAAGGAIVESAAVTSAAADGAGTITALTAGQAFWHSFGAKLLAGALALALVGGGIWAGSRLLKDRKTPPADPETVTTEAFPVPTQRMEVPPTGEKGGEGTEPATTEAPTAPTEPVVTEPGETTSPEPSEPEPTDDALAFLRDTEWFTESLKDGIWQGRRLRFYADGTLWFSEGALFTGGGPEMDGLWQAEDENTLTITLWDSPYDAWSRPETYRPTAADMPADSRSAHYTVAQDGDDLILIQRSETGLVGYRDGELRFHDPNLNYPTITEEDLRGIGGSFDGIAEQHGRYLAKLVRTKPLTISEAEFARMQEEGTITLQGRSYRYSSEDALEEKYNGYFDNSFGFGALFEIVPEGGSSGRIWGVRKEADRYSFQYAIGGLIGEISEPDGTWWIWLEADTPLIIGPGEDEYDPRTLGERGCVEEDQIAYPFFDYETGVLKIYIDRR